MKLLSVVLFFCAVSLVASAQSFNIWHSPAETLQATITDAAVSGKAHVVDCIDFGAVSLETLEILPPYDGWRNVSVILRDGAAGTGTILKVWRFAVNNTTIGVHVPLFHACGLGIKGTVGNALTIEFNSAVTGLEETVNASGHLE